MHSAVPGISWPAVPTAQGAALLALQYQLAHSAKWSADRLAAQQRLQLDALLAHAAGTIPFHHKRVGRRDFSRVPLLTREDLRDRRADLICRSFPKQHGDVVAHVMSDGTRVLRSGLETTLAHALQLRQHEDHAVDHASRLADVRHFSGADAVGARPPDGIRVDGWGVETDALYPHAPLSMLGEEASVEDQLAWLEAQAPRYLRTSSENVAALVGAGVERLAVEQVWIEGMAPKVVPWDVAVVRKYLVPEVGVIAATCPERGSYHVQAERFFVELVDDGGAAANRGRIVVTTLVNFAMPLLRFVVEDVASWGSCECGRGLPVLTDIGSSTDD